jgi:DGQHR domain-containing protein
MNDQQAELNKYIEDIDSRPERDRRVLTKLLDQFSRQKGKVFALKSEMGKITTDTGKQISVPSFVVNQTLSWIGKNIRMGSEMPFMRTYVDPVTGVLKVDESNAEELSQRSPDWRRMPGISAYLAHDKRRKFGSILAVISPTWVDNPDHENWGPGKPEKRALKSAYQFDSLDLEGRVGLLDLDEVHYLLYALDGQHRVMGIRGLQELQNLGHLQLRKQGGEALSKVIPQDEFMEVFRVSLSDMQSLLDETMTVELLPAVIAGETRREASQRVRAAFVAINAYMQKTGKSTNTLLSESDGFALVARKAGIMHPLFRDDRVNWKGANLPKKTKWYTTLETIRNMACRYLLKVDPELVKTWSPLFSNQVPMRPDEEEIEEARTLFFDFLQNMYEMPVFQGLENGDVLDEIRLFPSDFPNMENVGKGHLLTRPVGQEILAEAVGILISEGVQLEAIFKKLNSWDKKNGFSMHTTNSLWYGAIYDFTNSKINTRADIKRAAGLIAYMVRGANSDERKDLMKFAVRSRITGEANENKWIDFDGKVKTFDPSDPGNSGNLPNPIDSP